nr:MAG TPA: hypothetical protein [Bacteriophage sp.]
MQFGVALPFRKSHSGGTLLYDSDMWQRDSWSASSP